MPKPPDSQEPGAQPDTDKPEVPASADVVVVGGGILGLNAARRAAELGASVVLLEAQALGWGASSRNGGIVHPGFKWGPATLIRRYGPERAQALYRETLDAIDLVERIVHDHAIDCDWERTGHVELAYASGHVRGQVEEVAILERFGTSSRFVRREDLRPEVGTDTYFGGLVVEGSGGLHPGRYVAGLIRAARDAGVALHPWTRARRVRSRNGRSLVETNRGTIEAVNVVAGTNGYADGFLPALRRRVIPIGSYMIATVPLPEELARELSPNRRRFFDTKNFLYYWGVTADRRLVFGGRASFIPTSVDRTARILQRGMIHVYPQLRDVRIEFAWGGSLGFTFDRMPHVGRTGGVAYATGCCGSGVAIMTYQGVRIAEWLGGAPAPALASLPFPLVPAPYEGRPWFLPFVGEWYRLRDRLDAMARGR
jgi:glycine/D-amino acid oxidase-like deaminating enzyme